MWLSQNKDISIFKEIIISFVKSRKMIDIANFDKQITMLKPYKDENLIKLMVERAFFLYLELAYDEKKYKKLSGYNSSTLCFQRAVELINAFGLQSHGQNFFHSPVSVFCMQVIVDCELVQVMFFFNFGS